MVVGHCCGQVLQRGGCNTSAGKSGVELRQGCTSGLVPWLAQECRACSRWQHEQGCACWQAEGS